MTDASASPPPMPPPIPMPTKAETGHTLGPCAACQRAGNVAVRWDAVRAATKGGVRA